MKHRPRSQLSEACRGWPSSCRQMFSAWSLSHCAVADHADRRDRSITFDRLQVTGIANVTSWQRGLERSQFSTPQPYKGILRPAEAGKLRPAESCEGGASCHSWWHLSRSCQPFGRSGHDTGWTSAVNLSEPPLNIWERA